MKSKTPKNQTRQKAEACAYCNVEAARPVLLSHTFGAGARLVVITDVLTYVCDYCGQRYFKGETLKQLDGVLATPNRAAVKKSVMVASSKAA
jgi:YgiT-type zinc finger domain-containing protein